MSEVVKEIKLFSGDRSVQNYYAQQALIDSQHESQLEEATEANTLEIAKNMLKHGDSIHYISIITGLTEDQVQTLKEG